MYRVLKALIRVQQNINETNPDNMGWPGNWQLYIYTIVNFQRERTFTWIRSRDDCYFVSIVGFNVHALQEEIRHITHHRTCTCINALLEGIYTLHKRLNEPSRVSSDSTDNFNENWYPTPVIQTGHGRVSCRFHLGCISPLIRQVSAKIKACETLIIKVSVSAGCSHHSL